MRSTESRIKGAILGLACGDYMGTPFEFHTAEIVNYFLDKHTLQPQVTARGDSNQIGFYTDDTAMTLCLAESLIEKGFDVQDQFTRYKKWCYEGYMSADGKKAYGVGQNTLDKMLFQKDNEIPSIIANQPKEGGNGSLMRCLPVGLVYYQDINEIVDKSIKSSIVTHNNEVAVWSCVIFNTFVSYCIHNKDKAEFLSALTQETFYHQIPMELTEMLDGIVTKRYEELLPRGYSLNTLEIALWCFLNKDDYESALDCYS